MSVDKELSPASLAKELLAAKNNKNVNYDQVQGGTQVPKDAVQDQVILNPEIMSMILGLMGTRSLKKVRLVCKSWLLEAQLHIKRRGLVVRLHGDDDLFLTRVRKFILTMQKKRPLDLPLPFQSIEVDEEKNEWPAEELIVQLGASLLPHPLVITRLSSGNLSLRQIIQIVNRHSSSLEYLRMSLHPIEAQAAESLLDPEKVFPQLRYISLDTNKIYFSSSSFARIVAGIVKASPNLETFESKGTEAILQDEFSSQLMLALDIRSVKTLTLHDFRLDAPALQHFISYPFQELQNLRINILSGFGHFPLNEEALIATLTKSAATLRRLALWRYRQVENFAHLFPVCPKVQELALGPFRYSTSFLSDRFPSLRVLSATWIKVDVLADSWTGQPPLLGLKTLRLNNWSLKREDGDDALNETLPLRFFEKFPDLKRLRLNYACALECCRIKARGHPSFSKILEGVKHLELCGNDRAGWFEEKDEDGSPLFAALNGIEMLTLVKPNDNLLLIPFKDMPSLKVLQFPWGAYLEVTKLLEVAKGLEKVVITNCCSFPMTGDPWSSRALDTFFDSAPNAKCGCREWADIVEGECKY